jgi:hypothetical protein
MTTASNRGDGCREFRSASRWRSSRRDMLRFGCLSLATAGMIDGLLGRSASATGTSAPRRRIKSCLLWFQAGGVSQTDTFDMKPDCDETIRGEFRPIASNVPGMQVCEHLPRVARRMDRLCVVRSMHHRMLCHNPAIYAALAGREVGESKAVSNKTFASQDDYPHAGSVIARHVAAPPGLPPFVALPYTLRNGPAPSPGQNAGLLGQKHDPFLLLRDPSAADFRIDELELPDDMDAARLTGRRGLVDQIDHVLRMADRQEAVGALGEYYRRAFTLLSAQRVKQAFDLSQEDDRLRDEYGRNVVGQSVLLGRRLVEAGVPFVTVYSPVANIDDPSWDTHQNNFPRLKDQLLPPTDQALAALLDDMAARGLLEETLVIFGTEFGRTPQIGVVRSNNTNNVTGRDHWPGCYTILLAGGGAPGGRYFGASNRQGWLPKDDPIHVGDFAATLYDAFGIDPHATIADALGRPHILAEGRVVRGLWG